MIPLGLKETKELDWSTPLKVSAGLGALGLGRLGGFQPSPLIEQMRRQAQKEEGSDLEPASHPRL